MRRVYESISCSLAFGMTLQRGILRALLLRRSVQCCCSLTHSLSLPLSLTHSLSLPLSLTHCLTHSLDSPSFALSELNRDVICPLSHLENGRGDRCFRSRFRFQLPPWRRKNRFFLIFCFCLFSSETSRSSSVSSASASVPISEASFDPSRETLRRPKLVSLGSNDSANTHRKRSAWAWKKPVD